MRRKGYLCNFIRIWLDFQVSDTDNKPYTPGLTIPSMFVSSMWDGKEPTRYSRRVGHEVPGVVAVLCECMGGQVYIIRSSATLAIFIVEDAISVWMNLGKHLLFVWLYISSIKMGTRRTIRLDEVSSIVRLERHVPQYKDGHYIALIWPKRTTYKTKPKKKKKKVCEKKERSATTSTHTHFLKMKIPMQRSLRIISVWKHARPYVKPSHN